MKVKKDDWAFKIDGKTGDLELYVPKKDEYSFDELTVVAVSLMRFCQAIGTILNGFLKKEQKMKIRGIKKEKDDENNK